MLTQEILNEYCATLPNKVECRAFMVYWKTGLQVEKRDFRIGMPILLGPTAVMTNSYKTLISIYDEKALDLLKKEIKTFAYILKFVVTPPNGTIMICGLKNDGNVFDNRDGVEITIGDILSKRFIYNEKTDRFINTCL